MQTEIIKYSLADRGRKYRGKDRHFNIAAVVAAINSPATQERVRKRDMLGYYGHWPRVKFGMNPSEGGLESGIPSVVEPALVPTVRLNTGPSSFRRKPAKSPRGFMKVG